MDNQVVKLELPSGGSEMHIGFTSKNLAAITIQPGTYTAGSSLAFGKFSLTIYNSHLLDIGFKTLELLNAYVSVQANSEVVGKLTTRLWQAYTGSTTGGKLLAGKFEIMCTEAITNVGSFSITPILNARFLLSNSSTTDGTMHNLTFS